MKNSEIKEIIKISEIVIAELVNSGITLNSKHAYDIAEISLDLYSKYAEEGVSSEDIAVTVDRAGPIRILYKGKLLNTALYVQQLLTNGALKEIDTAMDTEAAKLTSSEGIVEVVTTRPYRAENSEENSAGTRQYLKFLVGSPVPLTDDNTEALLTLYLLEVVAKPSIPDEVKEVPVVKNIKNEETGRSYKQETTKKVIEEPYVTESLKQSPAAAPGKDTSTTHDKPIDLSNVSIAMGIEKIKKENVKQSDVQQVVKKLVEIFNIKSSIYIGKGKADLHPFKKLVSGNVDPEFIPINTYSIGNGLGKDPILKAVSEVLERMPSPEEGPSPMVKHLEDTMSREEKLNSSPAKVFDPNNFQELIKLLVDKHGQDVVSQYVTFKPLLRGKTPVLDPEGNPIMRGVIKGGDAPYNAFYELAKELIIEQGLRLK